MSFHFFFKVRVWERHYYLYWYPNSEVGTSLVPRPHSRSCGKKAARV